MKHVLHYGLQRSGTNFLESLFLENYKIKMHNSNRDRKHPIQKHYRLYDDKKLMPHPAYHVEKTFSSLTNFEQSLGLRKNIDLILVISKDPYSWYLSYLDWAKKCEWDAPKHHYVEEYMAFYQKWLDFAAQTDKVQFLSYAAFLENPEAELVKVEEKHQLELRFWRKRRGRKLALGRVSQSKGFSASKIDYYKNKKYLEKISKTDLDAINSFLPADFMEAMGYDRAV